MCTQKNPYDYSQQLYDNYRQAFVDYIVSTVRNYCPVIILFVYMDFSHASCLYLVTKHIKN